MLYMEKGASDLAELNVPVVWQICLSLDRSAQVIWQNCLYVEEGASDLAESPVPVNWKNSCLYVE